MKDRKVLGVSNTVFAATAAILAILVVAGFALYATKPTTTSVVTSPTTITSYSTVYSTSYSTVTTTSTSTKVITKPITQMSSGAFYDGQVITFIYTEQFMCPPVSPSFYPNSSVEELVMGCEVGTANMSAFPSGAAPMFVLVPAFAGLSIFGVHQLGATSQGFPTFVYNGVNYTIITQCGAALTQTACPDHMTLIYSPAFTAVEQNLGIKNGVFGLPEGVLPTPAHDHLVTFTTNESIPWYLVIVLVFDPNIFPNPITGQCQQIVPSNLSDPTANCLNSIQALEAAMQTASSAVSAANANNPIWTTLGKPTLQVVVPGISSPAQLMSASNSNMVLYFSDPAVYPYPI